MRKLLNYLLLLTVCLSIFSTSLGNHTVNAAAPGAEEDAEVPGIHFVTEDEEDKDKAKKASDPTKYGIEEGDLMFVSINQKAVTNIKYRTAGWITVFVKIVVANL